MDDEPTVPLKQHNEELRKADREAVKIALDAANEKARTHNDILGAMKDQQNSFVTKESVRWAIGALFAGIAVATAIFVAIGGAG